MRDQPLRVEVIDGRLVVSIGVDTLAWAEGERQKGLAFNASEGRATEPAARITDVDEWAKDISRAIQRESEDGSTPLSDLLDDAAQHALDAGSIAVEHAEPRPFHHQGSAPK
jgi:hypothetical protein